MDFGNGYFKLYYDFGVANRLLFRAVISEREDLRELAKKYEAEDFHRLLYHVGKKRGELMKDICELAKEWGVTNFDNMLKCAARGKDKDLRELAKDWRAINFKKMLDRAARDGHKELCALARDWGAE